MKVNYILLGLLVIVILLPITSFTGWAVKNKHEANLLVVDKTVPKFNMKEHRSLFWVLNHNHIFKHNGKRYRYKKDYYGFFPIKSKNAKEYTVKSIRLTEIDSLVENNSMVYFTDCYGVFYSEWYSGLGEIENSTLIYGGFNQNDYILMQKFLQAGKLVLAEYQMFGHPTNPLIRYKTQDLLKIRYTGWVGKYFKHLDSEAGDVPIWIINKYKKTYKKNWSYKKEGIIMMNQDQIIVLEKNIHLDYELPVIITSSNLAAKYNLPEKTPFTGWFEIINNSPDNAEMAWYDIRVNDLGKEILELHGLKSQFPAIIGSYIEPYFFYFAGDFSDNPIPIHTSFFRGVNRYKNIFYSKDDDDSRKFFWEFYQPLMAGILLEHSTFLNN